MNRTESIKKQKLSRQNKKSTVYMYIYQEPLRLRWKNICCCAWRCCTPPLVRCSDASQTTTNLTPGHHHATFRVEAGKTALCGGSHSA